MPHCPLSALAVGAPVAGAAAVVHVEHGEAAAGPVLDAEVERADVGAGRAAVAQDEQRRLLAGRRGEVAVARRVEEARAPSARRSVGNSIGCGVER